MSELDELIQIPVRLCSKCAHRKEPQGGWCYMFREEPKGHFCAQWMPLRPRADISHTE